MINAASMFCSAAVFVLKVLVDESVREYVRKEILSFQKDETAPEQTPNPVVINLTPDERIDGIAKSE